MGDVPLTNTSFEVMLTTSYSGVCMAEIAATFVQKALSKCGFQVGLKCYSQTEQSPVCQSLLAGEHL